MTDLKSIREKASKLRKEKNYQEAIESLMVVWGKTKEKKDKWDGWSLAFCLNKVQKHNEALNVCKEVKRIDPEFKLIKLEYVRAIYYLHLKNLDDDINYSAVKDYVQEVILHTESELENIFRQLSVFKIMDFCADKGMWQEVILWSEKVEFKSLSKEAFITSLNKKNIEIPSKLQSWYSKTSKAYEKLEDFKKCLEICNMALKDFPDDAWLKRRRAICEGQLGNRIHAIESLKLIAREKREWFIYRDIACFYFELKDHENALSYIIEACISSLRSQKPENTWEVYYFCSLILQQINQLELSKKHALLAYKLREQHGWKIPQQLTNHLRELSITLPVNVEYKHLLGELKKFWEKNKSDQLPKKEGKIKKLLPNGKAGFIKSIDGKDYYFRVISFNGNKAKLMEEIKVTFNVQQSYDKAKKKESEEAINIIPA
ncbi:MAG: hypothetical protein HZA77_10775 [Candidatus Schekmanbacteria bacterium]|nr:hypothetical protein [Candidatus Schekmanbacteria bacterium]